MGLSAILASVGYLNYNSFILDGFISSVEIIDGLVLSDKTISYVTTMHSI